MFKNKKIVVSASSSFIEDVENIVTLLKENGNDVLEYVRSGKREYRQVLYNFYTAIDNTDILLVINKDKNGVRGYIGTSVFCEINYAVLNNIIKEKNIDIYLLNDVDKDSSCYDEIKYFLDNNMVKVLKSLDKEKLGL